MELRREPSELKKLLRNGRHYKLQKKQVIQSTEDRRVFNLITSGYIKRYNIANDGSLGVQIIYGPNDIFPITLAFKELLGMEMNPSPEVYYYETISPVEIYTIDHEALKVAVGSKPMMYKELMEIAANRLYSTLDGLENLTLENSYKRVAHRLASLAGKFGTMTPKGVQLEVPLTQQDIADMLSITRETVSQSMGQLVDKKLIIQGKSIIVPDLQKLKNEAYS